MSMRHLEAEILSQAKIVLENRGLKQKEILAWSTGEPNIRDPENEVMVRLPTPGVNIIVDKKNDRRNPVLMAARKMLRNPDLVMGDILQHSTDEELPTERGEVVRRLPGSLGWIVVKEKFDRT
jgi:hypothetical protein